MTLQPGKLILANEFRSFNPSDIQTALWLDAADASTITESGGLVSQVNDKSGNGHDFSATGGARPTLTPNGLNGKPVFTYSGSQSLTSLDTPATWDFLHQAGGEVIGVWKAGNTPDPNTFYSFWGNNAGTVGNRGFYQIFDDRASVGRNQVLILAASTIKNTSNVADLYFDITPSNSHPVNTPTILGATLDLYAPFASDKVRHIVNGTVLPGNNTGNHLPNPSSATKAFQIGACGTNAIPLVGYIAEFIISQNKLSTDVRQKIEGYLAHKWGLTANLPADHPYKTVEPTP